MRAMAGERSGLLLALAIVAGAVTAVARAGERLTATLADGTPAPRECLFMPGTVVPRLAIGVRRPDEEPELRGVRHLEFRDLPSASHPASGIRRPLYRPLFVYAEHVHADGSRWCLLGSDYAVGPSSNLKGALGWVDARQLHFADGRYAYHFKNPDRVQPVDLYRDEADAYAALTAMSHKPPRPCDELTLVTERIEEDFWDPLAPDATPPFLELRRPQNAAKTDTTLTFPLMADNRLVHLAAVCGGPVDQAQLGEKRRQVQEKAGVEILFVIDDTLSMEKYIQQVANFIGGNLQGGGDATDLKIAVSWYRDRENDQAQPPEKPYDVAPLKPVAPQDIPAKVEAVRTHGVKTIKGDGAQARELMCEGLQAALEAAGFTPGANAMVFVIGDYGDRSVEAKRKKAVEQIAGVIAAKQLQVAFIRVGEPADNSFEDHAGEIKAHVRAAGGPEATITSANDANLGNQLAKLQSEMESRRSRLEAEIADLESRNRYSQPGPVMERRMADAGLTRQAFDQQHLQFFTPACGWLYHPRNPDGDPQLRELVFICRAEATALVVMLAAVEKQLEAKGTIDGAAAIDVLAKELAAHPRAAGAVRAAWDAIPEAERSLGTFLRDALGLRIRNPLLFQHAGLKPLPATGKSRERLRKSRDWLTKEKGPGPERMWYDSWLVLP